MPSRGAIHASTPFHSQAIVAAGPALPRVASVTSLKRGVAPMRLSYDVGGRMGGKVRHKSNSCCGLMASNPEHMDLSSICDTQVCCSGWRLVVCGVSYRGTATKMLGGYLKRLGIWSFYGRKKHGKLETWEVSTVYVCVLRHLYVDAIGVR
ncbi:hypothetical protein Vretimale_7336 [Volvox reticuliferus]|uniref:Uncharacterized protein n=1 Tax=Volvox reticuliferus TaxID=1737510 RepID=A0A8J4G950_9CHLO|nr:hypothetical protein Vretimale_7336 [Volvox reticuliferus]